MTAVTKSFGICPSGIDRPAAFCLEYRDVDGSTRVRSVSDHTSFGLICSRRVLFCREP